MVIEMDLAAAVPLMCGACATLPLYATTTGGFACTDGHAITAADLVLETGETWGVTPAGLLTVAPAIYVLTCAECHRHPFVADSTGTFVCAEGHEIGTRDLDLEPGQDWAVTAGGLLGLVETAGDDDEETDR